MGKRLGIRELVAEILRRPFHFPVTEETDVEVSSDQIGKEGGNGGGGGDGKLGFLKRLPRKVFSVLCNLPLAITEMFTIAALMADQNIISLGTVIEQGETPDFYFQKYPEDNPVLGFFTWRWIGSYVLCSSISWDAGSLSNFTYGLYLYYSDTSC